MSQTVMQPFEDIEATGAIDHVLRTTRQIHMQLRSQADTKASIMITVTSIVLSIAISQLDKPELRLPLLVLGGFSLIALLLAIVAVFPWHPYPKKADGTVDAEAPSFNLLFFGHFVRLDREEFARRLDSMVRDEGAIYRAIVDDLYDVGLLLLLRKYRFLRLSYVSFVIGAIVAGVACAVIANAGF